MSEPFIIAQNGEPLSIDQRWEWFYSRSKEAREQGANWIRCSINSTMPNLILFEAWKERPKEEGEPRWQLTLSPEERE